MTKTKVSKKTIVIGLGIAAGAGLAYLLTRKQAPPEPPAPGLANLYGKVTGITPYETFPLEEALVILIGEQGYQEVYSDAQGNYAFTNLGPGGYTIKGYKEGYYLYEIPIALVEGDNELNIELNLIGGIEITHLSIEPSEVYENQDVVISAQVENTSERELTHTITCEVVGLATLSKEVTLEPGESTMLSFWVRPTVAGTYIVKVNGAMGNFTVYAQPPSSLIYVSNMRITRMSYGGYDIYNRIEVDAQNIGNVVGIFSAEVWERMYMPSKDLWSKWQSKSHWGIVLDLQLEPGQVGTFSCRVLRDTSMYKYQYRIDSEAGTIYGGYGT